MHNILHWFLYFLLYLGVGLFSYTILYVLEIIEDLPTENDTLAIIIVSIFWLPVGISMGIVLIFKYLIKQYPKVLRASREKVKAKKIQLLANKVRREQRRQNKKRVAISIPKWL